MRLRVVALTAAVLATTVVASPRPAAPPPFAIKDARIVVTPEKTLERATIVFRDGVVESVGADVPIPADALVEDGRGLTVYPGFIDAGCAFPIEPRSPEEQRAREGAHPNLQEDPPIETPEARRRGIRAALELAATALLDGERRTQEHRAGFAVALAVPPRAFLAGQSAIFALGSRPRRSSVIATPAFLHASFEGPDGEHGYPHSLMGAHAYLRQAFADALHQRELEARAKRPGGARAPFDPDLDALLMAVDRKLRVAWTAVSDEDVERALTLGNELGLDLVVTDARHASKSAARLRRAHVPVILSLAWSPKPKPAVADPDPVPPPRKGRSGKPLEGPFFFVRPCAIDPAPIGPTARPLGPEEPRIDPAQEPRAVFEERERKRAEEVGTLRALFAAGVPVAVSSLGLAGPADVREHLREAIKAGLPEEVALAALTRDAALVLGLSDRLGSLAPGKLAFATVLSGNFADEKAKVRFTVVDGERLDAERAEDDLKVARIAGTYTFFAGPLRGELVLDAVSGRLTARVHVEGGREAGISVVAFENERLRFSFPKALTEKTDVPVDARWIAPDVLEGTATFPDGPRAFRADRKLLPHEGGER